MFKSQLTICFAFLFCYGVMGAEKNVTLPLPADEVIPVNQPVSAFGDIPGIVVDCKIDGIKKEVFLPCIADTFISSGRTKNAYGSGWFVSLIRHRGYLGLFKFDTSPLPQSAEIISARLRLAINLKPNSSIDIHPLKVDWDETATWKKTKSKNGKVWNGPKVGKDYDKKAIAKLTIDTAKPAGKVGENTTINDLAGFADLVKKWVASPKNNFGVLMALNGAVRQVFIPSREDRHGNPKKPAHFSCGGKENSGFIIKPKIELIKSYLLKNTDAKNLELSLRVSGKPKTEQVKTIKVYKMLTGKTGFLKPGIDYDPAPLSSFKVIKNGYIYADSLLPALQQWLKKTVDTKGLLILPEDNTKAIQLRAVTSRVFPFELTFKSYPNEQIFDWAVKPRNGVYATKKGGNLYYGDDRLRLWGAVIGFPRESLDTIDRLKKMGFNAIRLWGPKGHQKAYDEESVKTGSMIPAVKGDGGGLDIFDRFFAEIRRQGMFVMATQLMPGVTNPIQLWAKDGSYVSGGKDWEEWKKAVTAKGAPIRWFYFFDERLQKIMKKHAENWLTRKNLYTGKTYAEEECIAIWEINNECSFLWKVLEHKDFSKWPSYFANKLKKRWNDHLLKKYGNKEKLLAAWGKLDDGESIQEGTVKLAPTLPKRNDYPKARAADFIDFMVGLVDAWNQEYTAHCRSFAPKGVGVNTTPFSFDTQYRNNMLWNYSNSKGDVANFGMYFWPLTSMLTQPPGMYVMDANTVDDKITAIYETNISRPDPYRSEYPIHLAAFASFQDWDAIFFHYWMGFLGKGEIPDEKYIGAQLPLPEVSHFWTATHFGKDPVLCASMAAGGHLFRSGAVKPAKKPAIFSFGKKALSSYDNLYGVSETHTAFARGARNRFNPKQQEAVLLDGKVYKEPKTPSAPVKMGENVIYDWQNGRMIVDTPTNNLYVGAFDGPYRFKDGIVLKDVKTPFICFSLQSRDDKPLVGQEATKEAYVSAVFDAQNSGFAFNWDIAKAGGGFVGPVDQAKAVVNRGIAPNKMSPISFSLDFPQQLNASLTQYDFALRKKGITKVKGNNQLTYQDNDPMFMGVLTISSRGKSVKTPPFDNRLGLRGNAKATTTAKNESGKGKDVFNPIPGHSWAANYALTYQRLREARFPIDRLSQEEILKEKQNTILVSGTDILWKSPANIEITFAGNQMKKINATFTRPPSLLDCVADYEKRFGKPKSKKVSPDAFTESKVVWEIPKKDGKLQITLSETQGTMTVGYNLLVK